MKIITPRGELLEVARAIPYIEVGFEINEIYQKYREPVRVKSQKPNAVLLELVGNGNEEIFVGNISEDIVSDITVGLAVDGVFDLRRYEYQKETNVFCDTSRLGSEYPPYFTEIVSNQFGSMAFGSAVNARTNEDDEWDELAGDYDDDYDDYEE